MGRYFSPDERLDFALKSKGIPYCSVEIKSAAAVSILLFSLLTIILGFFLSLRAEIILSLILFLFSLYFVVLPGLGNYLYENTIERYGEVSVDLIECIGLSLISTMNITTAVKNVSLANLRGISSDFADLYRKIYIRGEHPLDSLVNYIMEKRIPFKEEIKSLLLSLNYLNMYESLKLASKAARESIKRRYRKINQEITLKLTLFLTLGYIYSLIITLIGSLYSLNPSILTIIFVVWFSVSIKMFNLQK